MICLWECSPPLWQACYAKNTLLKSHGMQLGHRPLGSLGGGWQRRAGDGLLGESWSCQWEVGGSAWGKELWSTSCAAGRGDLVVQPLLLETSGPSLMLSGVYVL